MGGLFSYCFGNSTVDEEAYFSSAKVPLLSATYAEVSIDKEAMPEKKKEEIIYKDLTILEEIQEKKELMNIVKEVKTVIVEDKKSEIVKEEKTEIKIDEAEAEDDFEEENDENSNVNSNISKPVLKAEKKEVERKFFNKNIPITENDGQVLLTKYSLEEYNIDKFKDILAKGFEIKKYGRQGRAKVITIWSSPLTDFQSILWKSNKSKSKPMLSPGLDPTTNLYHFDLCKVNDIVKGVNSFHSSKPSSAEKCFSLVTESRSLDIQCASKEEAEFLFHGFSDLLEIHSKSEKL